MKVQVIKDEKGENTGVFIPLEDWALIKTNYPDIDDLDNDIPEWQKRLLDDRLQTMANHPESTRPIHELFDELNNEL